MPAAPETSGRYAFLDYLRALAVLLVAWDHLANILPRGHGRIFGPAEWVRHNITTPLAIIQDFGWLGVALFFLISGFIISDRASREPLREFVVKRLFRIYPMLAVAVLLSAAFVAPRDQVTPVNVLLNLTLANYLVIPQLVLVGAAWTLVIEMVFYSLTAITQFARGSPHRIAFNLAVIAGVIALRGSLGANFALFAAAVSYLPILVMGQVIYWWLSARRLGTAFGLFYLLAAYGLFLFGLRALQPAFLPSDNSYLVSVAYAALLFVAMLHIEPPQRRLVRFIADTSYSMYLLHGIVGALTLAALIDRVPLALAIALSAAASLVAAFVTYRLVEAPFQRLGRRLIRRRPAPG